MSTRAAALLAAALLLAACGAGGGGAAGSGTHSSGSGSPASPLLPDDFKGVCSGATESRAADYGGSRRHKALYFETYEDELLDESSRLPPDWTAQFDANTDALAAVDVVACGVRTDQKLAKKCTGYERDDTDTKGTVNWYTATYELTAYAAVTGRKLGSTTVHADSQDCPTIATFDGDENEIDMYDSPSDQELASFLEKIIRA